MRPKIPVCPHQENLGAQEKQQALETAKIYYQKAGLESEEFLL